MQKPAVNLFIEIFPLKESAYYLCMFSTNKIVVFSFKKPDRKR
jgi:hypothetical protein